MSSGVTAFLVAAVIFIASTAAVLITTHNSSDSTELAQPKDAAESRTEAASLAELILGSPGRTGGATGCDWLPTSTANLPAACTVSTTCTGKGCYAGADLVSDGRLGLGESTALDASYVSFKKLQNLRLAPLAATADGYLNYEEAAEGLGLDDTGGDFHIRAYPALDAVAELLESGKKDPNLRVTYIGDIDVSSGGGGPGNPAAGLVATTPACEVSPINPPGSPQAYRLSTTVTNGGTTTTQFTGLFLYNLAGSGSTSQDSNSFKITPGASTTLFVDVPASTVVQGSNSYPRTCAAGTTIQVTVHDPSTTSIQVSTTLTAANAVTGATSAPRGLWLDTSKPYFVNPTGATSGCGDPVALAYDGHNIARNDKLAVKLHNQAGTQVFPSSGYHTFQAPNANSKKTVDVGCLAAGNYTATIWYYTGGSPAANDLHVTENVLVVTSAPAAYAATPVSGPEVYTSTAASVKEVKYLRTIVQRFCPSYFDSQTNTPLGTGADWDSDGDVDGDDDWGDRCAAFATGRTPSQPGDVFPDSKRIMNEDLQARLIDSSGNPRYDLTRVLVVGSGVDQTAMTSASAKHAVRDWVLGGGTLLVFGSDAQAVNWLVPLFHAAIQSSSGGIAVPDAGHSLLHVSNELDYPGYTNWGKVWSFNGQTAQQASSLFTNVVVQGSDPVTTVSHPGAFGSGSIVLTAWQPHDLYAANDPVREESEGLKLVDNLLMQGYQDLFLDYGPPLPTYQAVIPAVRLMQVDHPEFDEPIQVKFTLYVF